MILLRDHQCKRIYYKCGCSKTEIDTDDDQGVFSRRCDVCKRWTEFVVRRSPSGANWEVKALRFVPDPRRNPSAGPSPVGVQPTVRPAAPPAVKVPSAARQGRAGISPLPTIDTEVA